MMKKTSRFKLGSFQSLSITQPLNKVKNSLQKWCFKRKCIFVIIPQIIFGSKGCQEVFFERLALTLIKKLFSVRKWMHIFFGEKYFCTKCTKFWKVIIKKLRVGLSRKKLIYKCKKLKFRRQIRSNTLWWLYL